MLLVHFKIHSAATISSYIINEDKRACICGSHTCPNHNTPITMFHT
uniref:Uncharacterized protein n=1 Tax=Anguilla anguilla TaxID=7936 RepID=A0A0E9XGB0_ANGAN